MVPIVDAETWKTRLRSISERRATFDPEVEEAARKIVTDVAARGDEALLEYTERFDGVRPTPIRMPESVLEEALESVDPTWLRRMSDAAENIRRFHRKQIRESWYFDGDDHVRLGQRILPIERVGLYVPGGTAAYPSSVLMTVIPAQVAGVRDIHLASPPRPSGRPHPLVLAAAALVDARSVYAMGGAQAIAALAYGTESVPRVDKIAGPGSAVVAAAKKLVYGKVGIDSLAGPSEIVVLADDEADPLFVAHDLLSQAEHDVRASVVLVTTSRSVAKEVQCHLESITPTLARSRIAKQSLLEFGASVVAKDLDEAVTVVNDLAPEHLELLVREPWSILERIRHAGAVFLGPWSPEPVGDYFAGPNHVLPTGGTARFASALSVGDFVRSQSVIAYTRERLAKTGESIAALAVSEGLEAHARAIKVRLHR